jgi:FkbM family methyltransferase
MRKFWTATIVLVVVALIGGAAAMRSERGMAFRDRLYTNRHCCDLSLLTALNVTIQETRGTVFPSQIGQDKWVLFRVFPGTRDGFFVDVGSADGTLTSNTKALEERGWKGICIDPFPTSMGGRTCVMAQQVVSSVSGKTVTFHKAGLLGGIADTLDKWKHAAGQKPAVELTTVTLNEILERNNAPSFIHFMSLDIEGAELEALKGTDLNKYRFGAMAIEHNEEEPKRTEIMNYLRQYGYERVHTYQQDDFFVPSRQVAVPDK